MRKRHSLSYTVLSYPTMFSYVGMPSPVLLLVLSVHIHECAFREPRIIRT